MYVNFVKKINVHMAPPKGNQYWKLRAGSGRSCKIENAEILWQRAIEYFDYCDKHPRKREKIRKKNIGKKQKETEKETVLTNMPYTFYGLCAFLGISMEGWRKMETRASDNLDYDLVDAITRIREIIRAQQLEDGLVEAHNPILIARLLGLTDKTEVTSNNVSDMLGGKLEIVIHDTGTKLRSSEEDIDD
jgi:hypothetical protein